MVRREMTSQPRNSRRIARLRSNSRRILTITTISSIRSKAIIRTPSTHKTGTNTPRAAMVGEARVLPPPPDGASQQASMKAGMASIPSKAGTDKTPSRGGTASPEHRSMTSKALPRLLSARVTSIISKTTQTITSTAMVNVGLAGTAHLERSSLPRRL